MVTLKLNQNHLQWTIWPILYQKTTKCAYREMGTNLDFLFQNATEKKRNRVKIETTQSSARPGGGERAAQGD